MYISYLFPADPDLLAVKVRLMQCIHLTVTVLYGARSVQIGPKARELLAHIRTFIQIFYYTKSLIRLVVLMCMSLTFTTTQKKMPPQMFYYLFLNSLLRFLGSDFASYKEAISIFPLDSGKCVVSQCCERIAMQI
jgi:hypothetical protein